MKTTTEKIDGCQVVLNIEVEAEEMERAIKGAYSRVGAKTIVPGFRKGKAPPAMLEHYFGRDTIVQDASEHILPDLYEKAIQEQEIEVVDQPQVEIIQIEPLKFKATVPVRPVIELEDYHQIQFEPEVIEMNEEEVTEALEQIRYVQAPWEPVERLAIMGDLLAIDVEGTVDGNMIIDQKEGWYQLSSSPRICRTTGRGCKG